MTTQTTSPISVLILADQDSDQFFLQKKLQTADGWMLTVRCVKSGEQAVETLHESSYDLVFVSCKSPFDGLQALSRVRQHFTKLAVVMTSASADTPSAVEAIKKGALDYLTHDELKALDVGHLFRRLLEARNLSNVNMELRQVNQMKNEFIANISHELRTPLQVIIGYAKAMETGSLGNLSAEQTKATRSILERSEILLSTINHILQSREPADLETFDLKPLELRAWIEDLAKQSPRSLQKKSMRLETALPSEELWILAHAKRLSEAVGNLLSNACKFGPDGSAIRLTLDKSGSQARLSLHDEGPGVTPEILPHIFEKYFIAEQGPVRSHPGLGLGLPLAKEIVELHNGRIWVESGGKGKGTTAFISLPLASRDAPEKQVGRQVRIRKKKILIVEDNPELVQVLRLFMSTISPNLEITAVSDGFDALRHIEEDFPNLVILDIMMPGIDGIEVIRRMNLLPEEKHIPVLVLTGYMEAAQKALKIGAKDVLLKPFEKDIFIKKVLRLLKD